MNKHIIFDLDGTLIDSADGILFALLHAFDSCRLAPKENLTKDMIGPPLMEILSRLAGALGDDSLEQLRHSFETYYDTKGYQQITVFSGVNEMLAKLADEGWSIYIATNKRIEPSLKIINFLGWSNWFSEIFSLNSFDPICKSKVVLLERMLIKLELYPPVTIYVGDRVEDGIAAEMNSMPFIFANWGYGASGFNGEYAAANIASNPLELFDFL